MEKAGAFPALGGPSNEVGAELLSNRRKNTPQFYCGVFIFLQHCYVTSFEKSNAALDRLLAKYQKHPAFSRHQITGTVLPFPQGQGSVPTRRKMVVAR